MTAFADGVAQSDDITLLSLLYRGQPQTERFTVSDAGRPWNLLEHRDPDITMSADEREIGGLGILMVKKLMDDVSYVREQGQNVLRFRKLL